MTFNETWATLIWRVMGYRPNDAQLPIINAARDGTRFLLICGGERAGKSFTSAALMLAMMDPLTSGRYWIVGPDYYQARAEFEYIYRALKNAGVVVKESLPETKTMPWSLETISGATVETKTSVDITKIASFAIDGALMVEAAQQVYETWLKCRGRVGERRGFVILSGTLEDGLPWYGDMLDRWKGPNEAGGRSFSIPSWSNLAVYPGGRCDPELKSIEATTPADIFMMRYGAEQVKSQELVLPEFDFATHVKNLRLEPEVPVELAIDPGKNAYAVLFLQQIGPFTHVVDRVYTRGKIVHDVIPLCKELPAWKLVKKNALGAAGVIDFAAKQQHGGKSQLELWKELAGISLSCNYVHQTVSREALRYRLQVHPDHESPLILFNSHMTNAKAMDGSALDVLAEPELWKWPKRRDATRSSEAVHPIDSNNHAMKALSYWCFHRFGPIDERKRNFSRYRRRYWMMSQ